ncbi:MAG TPA: carbon-nitrogen hydrolase family protein [Candidatus Pacearchaeota archaeon]|nr:carbon-nitrogen hydrolase family protein [Candidatus Pacearchaeota archaeon]
MKKIKIAVAQIEVFDETDKNVKKILDFIGRASFKNADIVCFPESCLGDSVLDIKSQRIKKIQEKCKKESIYCIIGAHIKDGNKVFNSAILINRSGKIQYIYKKIHLFPKLDLKKTFPGKENRVIETDFGKIAIIVCWDFAFPEDIRKLSKKGAQIIFCPSYLLNEAKISKEVFRSYPITRAFENLVYFVTCDAFTDEVLGESYVCSPLKILNKIKNREGIIFTELDLNKLVRLRKSYDGLGEK